MKKILLSLLLSLSFISAHDSNYFCFSVHILPTLEENNASWNQSIELAHELLEKIESADTTDENEFDGYIKNTIAMVKDIFSLNTNNQLNIHATIKYEPSKEQLDGLTIAFEYIPNPTVCPNENIEAIRNLMVHLETYTTQENKEELLNNLNLLEDIFTLTYGKSGIEIVVN